MRSKGHFSAADTGEEAVAVYMARDMGAFFNAMQAAAWCSRRANMVRSCASSAGGRFVLVVPASWSGSNFFTCSSSVNTSWGIRVRGLIARHRSLRVTNAYISTLGGGYFMCRYIHEAQRMAENQLRVAQQLGDDILAARCRVHLVYNKIQLGKFSEAAQDLEREQRLAQVLGDSELRSVIEAAKLYCGRVAALSLSPVECRASPPARVGMSGAAESNTMVISDDFHRQRVVVVVRENV